MSLRAFSYGGGVQSTAALVLAAQRRLDYPLFIYANVGDDAEPETLAYVRDVAMPYAAEHGLELVERQKRRRDGTPDSLTARIARTKTSIPIPMRGRDGAPMNRVCTTEFKVRVAVRELRARGATNSSPAIVGLGITLDEIERVHGPVDPRQPIIRREYPLQEMYRQDCANLIDAAGLPVPPKSACWFCPLSSLDRWRQMRARQPERFEQAVQFERRMQERRGDKSAVYLTRFGRGLDEVVPDQLLLDVGDGCESGWCMT